jgi:hypothetical protein
VPLVDVLAPRVAEESSPKLRHRAAPPRRIVPRLHRVLAAHTALDGFAVSRATSRAKSTRNRAPSSKSRHTGEFAGVRRRSPLSAVARRRLRTRVHS